MNISGIEKIERLPTPSLGLLGAVHDAVVQGITGIGGIPTAGDNTGNVIKNDVGGAEILPAQGAWPAQKIEHNEFFADQHGILYPVVHRAGTSSYYPRAFERTLYTLAFSASSLPLRKWFVLNRRYAFRLFANTTDAVWNIVWEIGMRTDATTPGTPGPNIAGYTWLTPLLDEQVHITDVASLHDFGVSLYRDLEGTTEVWTGNVRRYGAEVAAASEALPTSNSFVLRLRLSSFDILDNSPNAIPRGYVAYFVSDLEK